MYNPIQEHRQEIIDNINKAFGNEPEAIEKAKWQIGEVRVDSRGIAHECYEYVNGKPHLRRVKKNKNVSTSTNDKVDAKSDAQSKTSTNNKKDNKSEFEIKFGNSKIYEYKGEKISEEIVQETLLSNSNIYSIDDKIENIKDVDENKEYNQEQIRNLFKYPEDISDKRLHSIVVSFKDLMGNIDGNVDKKYSKDIVSKVIPFSLKYAKIKGKVSISDFKVNKIGELNEKIKSNNIYSLMNRGEYNFYEVSYNVKTKKKDIKVKTYLAEDETLSTRDIASFM